MYLWDKVVHAERTGSLYFDKVDFISLQIYQEALAIWNLAATKGREKPTTRKVVRLMATGTLRVGPEGKGRD